MKKFMRFIFLSNVGKSYFSGGNMGGSIFLSDSWLRILWKYSHVFDFCEDIKRMYQIDDEKIEIKKIKRLIQDVFKIRAPRLFVRDLQPSNAGGCIEIRDKKVIGIYIDRALLASGDIGKIYECIAHEMRHVWQYKKGYKLVKQGDDFREYALSESEVDAEAFANIFMMLFFGTTGFWYDPSRIDFAEEMTLAVEERTEKIEIDVIWMVIFFGRKHFGAPKEAGKEK